MRVTAVLIIVDPHESVLKIFEKTRQEINITERIETPKMKALLRQI